MLEFEVPPLGRFPVEKVNGDVFAVTDTGVVPSVYVKFHGPVPVNAISNVVVVLLQIVSFPETEITAVGLGSTNISTSLLISAGQTPLVTTAW